MPSFSTIVPQTDITRDGLNQFDQAVQQGDMDAFDVAAKAGQDQIASYQPPPPNGLTPDDPAAAATAKAVASGADPANLARARQEMGSQAYTNLCEKFVENASGKDGQFASAIDAWNQQPDRQQRDASQIRPGDLVYYGPSAENGYYGHAAIYSGQGKVISATSNGVKETPAQGYFGAPMLGYIPAGDNQQLAPSPMTAPQWGPNYQPPSVAAPGGENYGHLSHPLSTEDGLSLFDRAVQQGNDTLDQIQSTPPTDPMSGAPMASADPMADIKNFAGGLISKLGSGVHAFGTAPTASMNVTDALPTLQSVTAPAGESLNVLTGGKFGEATGQLGNAPLLPLLGRIAQTQAPLTDADVASLPQNLTVGDAATAAASMVQPGPHGAPVGAGLTPAGRAMSASARTQGIVPEIAGAAEELGSNLNRAHLPEDVLPALDKTYTDNAAAIDAARRGVIPDAVAKDLAQATGQSVDDIVSKWKPGDAANEETMIALRNAMVDRTRAAQAAQSAWAADPNPTNYGAYQSSQTAATNMQTVVQGLTAEAGRALRAIGIDVTDPLVLAKLADDPQFVSTMRSGFEAKPPIGQAARDALAGSDVYRPTGDITTATPSPQDMLPGLEPPAIGKGTVAYGVKPFAAETFAEAQEKPLDRLLGFTEGEMDRWASIMGYSPISGEPYPVFQGNGPEFSARPDMLGQPNPDVNPNDLLNKVAAATKPIQGVQNMLKQMLVSASVFHPVVLNTQLGRTFLSQGAVGDGARALAQADRAFFQPAYMKDWQQTNRVDLRRAENFGVTLLRGVLGPDVAETGNQLTRTLISSAGSALAGGVSAKAQGESDEDALKRAALFGLGGAGAGALAKPLNAALWERFVPVAKLETFKLLEAKYGGEAAATSVNNLFGGQNLAKIGRSQQVQDIFRTAVLAPDWLESWARNAGAAVKPGPEGDIARRYWATTLTAGAVTMEGLNFAFNHHLTNDNEPGHHFELETTGLLKLLGQNPDRRTYLDMLELGPVGSALNAADRGDPGVFLRGHLNIIPSAGLDAVQNKAASSGKEIVPTGTPAIDAALPEAGAAASHMVPIGLAGFQNSQVPVAQQVFSGATGMRSSEGKAFSQDALNLYQNAGMNPPTPTANLPVAGAGTVTLTQPELRHLETMEAPVYNELARRLNADPRWPTMKPEQQALVLAEIDRQVRPGLERAFLGQLGRDRIVSGLKDYADKEATQRMSMRARVSGLPGIVGNDMSRLGNAAAQRLPQFTAPSAG